VRTFPGGRRSTARDVAAAAAVSLATVSRVINHNSAVDPALATLVRDVIALLGSARRHGHVPQARRPLVSKRRSRLRGRCQPLLLRRAPRRFEEVARTRGVLTFVGSSDDEPKRERQLAEAFIARGVDGLLVVPAADDQSYLSRDREAGLPLVFVDRPPRFIDADVVLTDNFAGARQAAEHLLANGHQRIGYLGDRQRIFTAAERLRGYRQAFAAERLRGFRQAFANDPHPALERLELRPSDAAYHATRAPSVIVNVSPVLVERTRSVPFAPV
jgi:LacI family transcriptional regulator